MDSVDRDHIVGAIDALTVQVRRIADQLVARDKESERKREERTVLRALVAEVDNRLKGIIEGGP